jgi:hypothetical protein
MTLDASLFKLPVRFRAAGKEVVRAAWKAL